MKFSGSLSISVLFAALASATPAAADEQFIQTWLDAKGGCGNPASSPLAFVFAGQDAATPFGKASADWTDNDLVGLKKVLATCEETAVARGNPYFVTEIRNDILDVLEKVPVLVAAARNAEQARVRQLEARKAIAQQRISKSPHDKEQAKAAADADVTRLEGEADRAEEEAAQARAEAAKRVDQAAKATEAAKAKAAEAAASLQDRAVPSPEQSSSDTVNSMDTGELRELPDRRKRSGPN